jgi:two-component system chemotaxis sensor kinase CheA
MNELLVQFVTEARDLLQDAGEDLMALERAPDNEQAINRLFRSVHTLKGSSGLFDAKPLTEVLHAAEDIFQAVREHELALTPDMADATLKALDQIGSWIEHLDQHETLPEDAAPVARAYVAELRGRFGPKSGKAPSTPELPGRAASTQPPADLWRWFDQATLTDAAAVAADAGFISLISYQPDDGCFFRGEDPLHLAMQIPGLLSLGVDAREPWGALTTLDPFACNVGFHALSKAGRAEIEALFRYVPEQVTITELAVSALSVKAPASGSAGDLPPVVLAILTAQIDLLRVDASVEALEGRIAAAARTAANALRFAGRSDLSAIIDAKGAAALSDRSIEGLIVALESTIVGALEGDNPTSEVLDPAAARRAADGPTSETTERLAPRTLRVDQEKIDALMTMVGELVVAKNSLPFLARRAEQHFGLRELGVEIKDQYGVIDRIAQELQAAVMAVRMMPVGQVFQRFPRLVRDLSRKLGKDVDLVIEGEGTEADKNVIEALFDPLLHMVRNSLDHGVETPDQRAACGKPRTATVRLSARHEGDQVVIEVIDDGRGIDPEVIKHKAYERGLLDEARLASISDDDAIMLVFTAGFSTAETVSDVSGRGVGMDVVRSAVEKASGRIAMTSVKGNGAKVRLTLPLSMAVSRVMTVGLGDRLFGIPMDLIHGTVKTPRKNIVRIKSSEAFVLRDRIVPLVHLSRLLGLPDEPEVADEVAVLVVRIDGQTIGLGVSAFGEGMEVILKPLGGVLANLVGYTGSALLGDGRVLLVLDLKELIP